jgi:DNA-binding transcriptional ArsR family regulator
MFTGTLNLTLETLQAIAAISHLLSWREFRTYTLILSGMDQNTSLVRVNQDEISEASGYSLSTIKRHIEAFRSLGLMRIWRGPGGSNYYRVILPLTGEVVQAVRDRIPEYGMEPKRHQRKKASVETILINNSQMEQPMAAQEVTEENTLEPITEAIPTGPASSEPALDAEITALLGALERRTVRNNTCHFLESLGFLGPHVNAGRKSRRLPGRSKIAAPLTGLS